MSHKQPDTAQGDWIPVVASAVILPGEMTAADIELREIAVYNVAGKYFATDNICSHGQALLTDGWLDEAVVECPLHGGRFDVTTGQALCEPAKCPVRTYRTRIVGETVQIFIPRYDIA